MGENIDTDEPALQDGGEFNEEGIVNLGEFIKSLIKLFMCIWECVFKPPFEECMEACVNQPKPTARKIYYGLKVGLQQGKNIASTRSEGVGEGGYYYYC